MSQGGRPRQSRNRTVAAVGSVVAFGGLGYYLYSRWQASSSSSLSSSSQKGKSENKRRGPPLSLSLSLPLGFVRTRQNLSLLTALLMTLSQDFLVTLIVPPNVHEPEADGFESIEELAHALEGIQDFDTRRVLEYSTEDGRLALARALGCNAHCEVMLESMGRLPNGHTAAKMQSLINFEEASVNDTEDGDVTPRATSPARPTPMHPPPLRRHHSRDDVEGERKAAMLEKYHAEMARIRKSSSLLVFLLLPVAHSQTESLDMFTSSPSKQQQSPSKRASNASTADLDTETILRPFLLPGQRDLSSRVPGVKVIDCRILSQTQATKRDSSVSPMSTSPSQDGTNLRMWQAWREGASRLCRFSVGWS